MSTPHADLGGGDAGAKLDGVVAAANDPREQGAENDRVPRAESYVKDFKPMRLGEIKLESGEGDLVLKAISVPGRSVIDFRLLMLTRMP